MTRDTGRLIVFEGAEGAGKTTQLRRLASRLAALGTASRVLREPGGTTAGERVRDILLDPGHDLDARTEALLFMASRAELVQRVVKPALEMGEIVLLDRFFLSTYAYQIAGRGLPESDIRAANALATAGLVPSLTILLHQPAAEGLARASHRGALDRMERSSVEFHERVSRAFAEYATLAWQRAHPECGPIVGVDARGAEEDVANRVSLALSDRWPETFHHLAEPVSRPASSRS